MFHLNSFNSILSIQILISSFITSNLKTIKIIYPNSIPISLTFIPKSEQTQFPSTSSFKTIIQTKLTSSTFQTITTTSNPLCFLIHTQTPCFITYSNQSSNHSPLLTSHPLPLPLLSPDHSSSYSSHQSINYSFLTTKFNSLTLQLTSNPSPMNLPPQSPVS